MVIFLALGTVFALFITCLTYEKLQNCRQEKEALEEKMLSHQRMVYVAVEKLPKGSVIKKELLHQEIRYIDQPQEEFATESAIGKTLAFDVAAGTCLRTDMLYAECRDIREFFLSEAELPEYLQAGDRIDVRIRYKNAEDYIVLSDKILIKCEPGKGMVIGLSEEEILLISSAVADSERYDGTLLYVTKYPEYEPAEPGISNYIANLEILTLLKRENTEGESRIALEKRLMQYQ